MKRVLGIDYGNRRIGIAISDPLSIIAKPLTVIDRKEVDDFFIKIIEIITNNNVSTIVVGLPLTLKGNNSQQTDEVITFIEKLEKKIDLPIIQVDERLSSLAAEKALKQQGIKVGYNKALIDETAAAIFLQEYLDSL